MIVIIKLCKWLYINPLTIVLFILCFITRKLELLAITYAVMLAHELAHLSAALAIGLKPSYIAIQPFGVNLKLKNRLVYSLADEMILYLAGPLVNAVLSLSATILRAYMPSVWLDDFIIKNLALFLMNLLPVVPLDGGIIIKKIMMHRMGYQKANRMMRLISTLLTTAMVLFGIYLVYRTAFNFSVLFLCVFLLANIFTQKEKYNIDFIRELMFFKEKCRDYQNKKVTLLVRKKGDDIRKIAERFTSGNYYIIYFLDKNGQIDDIVTETELIQRMVGFERQENIRAA